MARKNELYNKIIKSNDPSGFKIYERDLKEYCEALIYAIDKENYTTLHKMGWPSKLDECIKYMNLRTEIKDIIDNCMKFQYNRSPRHLEELELNNSGLNI
jgi:hypothetical protein